MGSMAVCVVTPREDQLSWDCSMDRQAEELSAKAAEKKHNHLQTLESGQTAIFHLNVLQRFKSPFPTTALGKKRNKAHTFIGIALMCCSAPLITAKSHFCEEPRAKRLSASQLLIQHMLFYSVGGKRIALHSHCHLETFHPITYTGSNSLAKLDNKPTTGLHIPVLS